MCFFLFTMVAEVMNMKEENKKVSKLFRKRWVVPSVYLLSAALILTGVLWFQSKTNDIVQPPVDEQTEQGTAVNEQESVPVQQAVEQIIMPVLDPNAVEIAKPFYDFQASAEEQEAALVSYNDEYYPNKGVDIAMKNGESFDVTASLSGTVIKAEKDPLFGYIVHIQHDRGVVTVYQSLKDVQVKTGDTVKQGQVIAKAGTSEFNKEAGVHVHFEIRKDGQAVNPVAYFDQPLSALENKEQQTTEQQETNQEKTNEQQSDPSSTVPDASIGMART
ncbi:M23 family metallopeptidase [Anoxybacillus flavithermus]|uniref:M23 family metallopeptidase n=2 Tax=Anoxybacillaceae TaxID=3120669 RepID=A0AAX2A5D7_9BACL|nr:M23 family metallopeptidase [Anoxybacillus flavithermus]MBE2929702.1 M23 family metallopeptidase [Anoxybacillus flavithermus]MBE2937389.1 M23 family metallopeptidase [Anoxybacillus flavithermus]MBE2945086.1 M23 family metallopeptidase [Anoxybacillus flavithermus]MBE2948078.1 M23 family metallopeptidase [Anoxybacillus flavithermus]